MATDLDWLTIPTPRNFDAEIFNPLNAWPGAPARIYLELIAFPGGIIQMGYDPVGAFWLRSMNYGGAWSTWQNSGAAITQPPPLVDDEAVMVADDDQI